MVVKKMRSQALRRKLRSIRLSLPQKIIALLAFVAAGLVWILEQIWSDAVVNFIKTFIPYPSMISMLFEWGKNHPGEISRPVQSVGPAYRR